MIGKIVNALFIVLCSLMIVASGIAAVASDGMYERAERLIFGAIFGVLLYLFCQQRKDL